MKVKVDNCDLLKYEKELYNQGITLIGGVDEAGRGPLVGPVVAACVILPENYDLPGLNDSKQLTEKKRDKFYDIFKEKQEEMKEFMEKKDDIEKKDN